MITLLTGVPGSGKTLYAVWKLLRGLIGSTVDHTDEGGKHTKIERRIFSNINGLLLDHTLIDKDQIATWHQWAKPGDIIVADEVQKVPEWKKAPAGSKVPPCIEALETHRHMGVDLIILTQGPMLIHDNVTRLVGRHLHLRRLGNMPFATVYEWDGCSRSLIYKNTMSKAPFWYPKDAYKLYKSAEVHTKQKRSAPALLWVVGAALLVFTTQAPGVYNKMMERFNPTKPVQLAKAEAPKVETKPPVPIQPLTGPYSAPTPRPGTAPGPNWPGVVQAPAIAGCVRYADRCACLDTTGKEVEPDVQQCLQVSGANRPPAIDLAGVAVREVARQRLPDDPAELETLRWMASRRGS